MSALFWYNFLAAAGLAAAAFTIYKKKYLTELSTWLIFFLYATSLPWLGEFIVLGFFNSYAYKLDIYQSPWADNLLGHLILNSSFWPGAAVVVVGYRLGFGGISLIAALFFLVEYLFLKVGIYEHHWWRSYMTTLCIFCYLAIIRVWFPLMNERRQGLVRVITLYLAAVVVIHTPLPIELLAGKQRYFVSFLSDLFPDLYLTSIVFNLSYNLVEAAVILFFFLRDKWYWKLMPYILSLGGQIYLARKGILIIQGDWSLAYSLALYTITLTICLFMAKYTLRPPPQVSP